MSLLLGAINTGDILAQLIMFTLFFGVLLVIILLFISNKKKDNRLKRLENKIDQLLAEKQ